MKTIIKGMVLAGLLLAGTQDVQAHFFSGWFSKNAVASSDQNTISCTRDQAIGFGIFSLGVISFTAFKFWELKRKVASVESRATSAESRATIAEQQVKLHDDQVKLLGDKIDSLKSVCRERDKKLTFYRRDRQQLKSLLATTRRRLEKRLQEERLYKEIDDLERYRG
jgi:hypothetical protein